MNVSDEQSMELGGLTRVPALSASSLDPLAEAFRSDGRLLIGIDADQKQTVERLLDDGILTELEQRGLVASTRISEQRLPHSSLTLEQDIDLSTRRPSEYSASMLKEAALVMVDVAIVLDRNGYILNHVESNHVGFDAHGSPKFIAMGQIRLKGSRKFPYSAFVSAWLGPLTILARLPELGPMVRRSGSVDRQELLTLTHPHFSSLLRGMDGLSLTRRIAAQFHRLLVLSPFGSLIHLSDYGAFIRSVWAESRQRKEGGEGVADWTGNMLERLRKRIEALRVVATEERWSAYHDDYSIPQVAAVEEGWQRYFDGPRPLQLLAVLENEEPTTLLDLGANQGYFSLMAAHLGFRTMALDYDGGAIDSLYHSLKVAGFRPRVCPGVVDFTQLTPHEWPRFRADVTLALGFTHHMRLVEMLPWEHIAAVLGGVTQRILVTEFKEGTGARAAHVEVIGEVAADYRLENFTAALGQHFSEVEVLGEFSQSAGASGRHMIVCRK